MFGCLRGQTIRRLWMGARTIHTYQRRPMTAQQMRQTSEAMRHIFLDGKFVFLGTNLVAIGLLPLWFQKRVAGTTAEAACEVAEKYSELTWTVPTAPSTIGPVTMQMDTEARELPLTPEELTEELGVPMYPQETRPTETLVDSLCAVASLEDGYMSILSGNNEGNDGRGEEYLSTVHSRTRYLVTEGLWNLTGRSNEPIESLQDLVDLIPHSTLQQLRRDFHKGVRTALRHTQRLGPSLIIERPYGQQDVDLEDELEAALSKESHIALRLSQVLAKYPARMSTEVYAMLFDRLEQAKLHHVSYAVLHSLLDDRYQPRKFVSVDFSRLREFLVRICHRYRIPVAKMEHLFDN